MNKIKNILKSIILGVSFFTPIFSMEKEENIVINKIFKFLPLDLLVKHCDYSRSGHDVEYQFDVSVRKHDKNNKTLKNEVDQQDLRSNIEFVFNKDKSFKYEFHDFDIEMKQEEIKESEAILQVLLKEPIKFTEEIQELNKDIELYKNEIKELRKISQKVQFFKNTKHKSMESLAYQFFQIQTSLPHLPSFEMNDFNIEFLVSINFGNICFVNLEALQWLYTPNLTSIEINSPCKEILFFATVIKSMIKASLPYTNMHCNNILLNDPNISRSKMGSIINENTKYLNCISVFYDNFDISKVLTNDYILYKSYHSEGVYNNRVNQDLYKDSPVIYNNPREYKKMLLKKLKRQI